MVKTLWTIGHSTLNIELFVATLQQYRIELLVDVRSLPGSNRYPQFNSDNLKEALEEHQIGYIYMKQLGGLRPKKKDSKNTVWRNQSFRNYADYMESESFKEGVAQLEQHATKQRTAIMCAEVLWWRCHRSMIADYLKSQGWHIFHIQSKTAFVEHPYTKAASIVNGELSYAP